MSPSQRIELKISNDLLIDDLYSFAHLKQTKNDSSIKIDHWSDYLVYLETYQVPTGKYDSNNFLKIIS